VTGFGKATSVTSEPNVGTEHQNEVAAMQSATVKSILEQAEAAGLEEQEVVSRLQAEAARLEEPKKEEFLSRVLAMKAEAARRDEEAAVSRIPSLTANEGIIMGLGLPGITLAHVQSVLTQTGTSLLLIDWNFGVDHPPCGELEVLSLQSISIRSHLN
jgi:hypothetical protein